MTVENSALMQAFLNGAGIPSHMPVPALTPEFMEMIGKLLATSIQGTVELSALRTLMKREVNAEVTMVVVRNNNPIKFFRDSQTILTLMLRKKMPGFMGPVDAMEDAYQDLRAHQLGVVAGSRAAMANTLGRMNPARLARKLEAPSLLDAIFPTGRNARLWDHYVALFQEIALEVQDDFQSLFGAAFVEAYEQEVERARNGDGNE
jgi:FHA domain-containing protein